MEWSWGPGDMEGLYPALKKRLLGDHIRGKTRVGYSESPLAMGNGEKEAQETPCHLEADFVSSAPVLSPTPPHSRQGPQDSHVLREPR